jgi:rhodanese-related sulfurtransferase
VRAAEPGLAGRARERLDLAHAAALELGPQRHEHRAGEGERDAEQQSGVLERADELLADLEAKLTGAVKNKATPVILVCASGMRSKRAVAIAKKLGYENSHSLAGGMGAWRTASLPVEKA